MSKTLNLYYVVATDLDGNNKDIAIWADTPAQAFELWEGYYYEDAEEWRAGGDEPHAYTGAIFEPKDISGDDHYDDTDLRIYQIPLNILEPKALAWHGDMPVVGWKEEA